MPRLDTPIIIGLDRGRPFLVDRVLSPYAGERLNPNAGCPQRALMRLDQPRGQKMKVERMVNIAAVAVFGDSAGWKNSCISGVICRPLKTVKA